MPVLHLLAGPNGAGKSTYASRVLIPVTHLEFVNADDLAKARWPDPSDAEAHAREASELAATRRRELMATGTSFITETVFSHGSKVDLVRDATARGYFVYLHVVLVPEDYAVRRVAFRVDREAGHSVPVDKIRARYARLWALVAQARDLAGRTTCYDNSRARAPFRVVAEYEGGVLLGDADWPSWTPVELR